MQPGGWKWELFTHVPLMHRTDPTGGAVPVSPTGSEPTWLRQQEEGRSPLGPGTAQPMRSHHTWNFQFPLMESLFTTIPPQSLKETASSLLLCTCVWFPVRLHATYCKSLLFLNKPIFCWRNVCVKGQQCAKSHHGTLSLQATLHGSAVQSFL